MRLFIVSATALLLAAPVAKAAAAVPDCEPVRCAVQQAINDECPCDAAKNHGKHVSCVAHVVKRLSKEGQIPTNCKGKVKRCAARSICGKPDFVTCEIPELGSCDAGTGSCVEDPSVLCTEDAECVVGSRCKIKSTEERCTAKGGVVGTESSCCAVCPTPTPAPTP